MNIDYAAIIAAAEKRKNALQEIEKLVQKAPHYANLAAIIGSYTAYLAKAYKDLDNEGKMLLPEDLRDGMATAGDISTIATKVRKGLELTAKFAAPSPEGNPSARPPFKTPVRVEDGRILVGADHETILEAYSHTDAELEAIVVAVNAYFDDIANTATPEAGK